MDLRRSKRALKPKVLWEERAASFIAFNIKLIEKTAKKKQETALKLPTVGPVLEAIKIDIPEHLQRIKLPITGWEQKGAPSAVLDPKIPKKAARTKKKTALKPIAVGPLPEDVLLDTNDLPELPTYKPPLDL